MFVRATRAAARAVPKTSRQMATSVPAMLTSTLQMTDPEIFNIIRNEGKRQRDSLCLIPSENFTSQAVLDALGSVMQNKYSEGYPGARYYGGNEFIDQVYLNQFLFPYHFAYGYHRPSLDYDTSSYP